MNPTEIDSPKVKSVNNCHLMGDSRLARGDIQIINQAIVETKSDNIGTAVPLRCTQLARFLFVPKIKMDAAVTNSCPVSMA
mmetsp:Transcript_21154/g.25475  ORF Transcript_21154/g.25475 Transcript_21154/m.25475 type:complete len:81 (-) Transcript_21154:99-341(-)